MSLKRKLATGILVGMLGVVASGALVSANNHGDTKFAFAFLGTGSVAYTESRPKYDDSFVYVYPQVGIPFTASVVNDGYGSIRCNQIYVSPGHSYYMTNWAFEDNNYRALNIRIKGTAPYGGGVNGLWSPDSI